MAQFNILVNSEYHSVITDFGSARRIAPGDPETRTEQTEAQPRSAEQFQATFCASSGTITLTGNKYTLRWAAPELLWDDQVSLGSDIWALGWIVYEVEPLNSSNSVDPGSRITFHTGYDQLDSISRCLIRHHHHYTRHSRKTSITSRRGPSIVDPWALLPHVHVLEKESY